MTDTRGDTRAATVAEIRPLTTADWEAMRAARLAALAEAPYAFASTLAREEGFTPAEWRQRLERIPNFGAWRAGELVGMAACFAEEDPSGWHLVGMWVSPAERGTGVAGGLVEAVCDVARACGARQVALWVTEVNQRAQAFYRRAGFTPTGDRALVRPSEPDHWELRMVRPVG